MTKRRFTQLVYVLLLLFAQQVAYTHAAWHARENAPVHQPAKGDASLQGDLCGLHGTFSQVLGGVQPGTFHLSGAQGVGEAILPHFRPCNGRRLQVPLPRGPPVFF